MHVKEPLFKDAVFFSSWLTCGKCGFNACDPSPPPPLPLSLLVCAFEGIIVAPTRELVLQIDKEAKRFGKPFGLQVTSIYGGGSRYEQTKAVKEGTEIVYVQYKPQLSNRHVVISGQGPDGRCQSAVSRKGSCSTT